MDRLSRRLKALPWFPLVALPSGIALLQFHGGQFWAGLTHSYVWGWSASAALEWIALWAWARQKAADDRERGWNAVYGASGRWLVFAGVCTALLVAGPLYQVGGPLLEEANVHIVTRNRVSRADEALNVLKQESIDGAARAQGIVALSQGLSAGGPQGGEAVLRALRQANADARRREGRIVALTDQANKDEAALYGPAAQGQRGLARGMAKVLAFGHLLILCVFSAGSVLAIRELAGAGKQAESTAKAGLAGADVGESPNMNPIFAGGRTADGIQEVQHTGYPPPHAANSAFPNHGIAAKAVGNAGETVIAAGEMVAAIEETDNVEAAQPEPGEPEATVRTRAARQKIEALWPGETQQARASHLGASERDLSLLWNHERLARQKASDRRVKIISEGALRRIEQALEAEKTVPLAPVSAPARANLQPVELL